MNELRLLISLSPIIYGCFIIADYKVRQQGPSTSKLNTLIGAVPLLLLIAYTPRIPGWVQTINVVYYGLALFGAISGCWLPYFAGATKQEHVGPLNFPLKPTPLRIITNVLATLCLWLALNL